MQDSLLVEKSGSGYRLARFSPQLPYWLCDLHEVSLNLDFPIRKMGIKIELTERASC